MTKILRQISPEIFDQIHSLANKQDMSCWQIIFRGAVAACLPAAPPCEALCGSRSQGMNPSTPEPLGRATLQLLLLLLLSERRMSLPLCSVTLQTADPAAVFLTNKKFALRLVKKMSFTQRRNDVISILVPARCFRISGSFSLPKRILHSAVVANFAYTLLAGKSVRFASWQKWILTRHWYLTENALSFLLWFPAWFAVFVSVGFWRDTRIEGINLLQSL